MSTPFQEVIINQNIKIPAVVVMIRVQIGHEQF